MHASAQASSKAFLIKKPPKTLLCMFRCSGKHTIAFFSFEFSIHVLPLGRTRLLNDLDLAEKALNQSSHSAE